MSAFDPKRTFVAVMVERTKPLDRSQRRGVSQQTRFRASEMNIGEFPPKERKSSNYRLTRRSFYFRRDRGNSNVAISGYRGSEIEIEQTIQSGLWSYEIGERGWGNGYETLGAMSRDNHDQQALSILVASAHALFDPIHNIDGLLTYLWCHQRIHQNLGLLSRVATAANDRYAASRWFMQKARDFAGNTGQTEFLKTVSSGA
jgi:hypothetical protein